MPRLPFHSFVRAHLFRWSQIVCVAVAIAFGGRVSYAQVVSAVIDERSFNLVVSDGIREFASLSGGAGNGFVPFAPMHFLGDISAGDASALIDIHSEYLELEPGNVTNGMIAHGRLAVKKAFAESTVVANALITYSLLINSLPSGFSIPFRLHGWTFGNTPYLTVKLNGPGVNVEFGASTLFNQQVNLTNGVYTLDVELATFSFGPEALNHDAAFGVTLRRASSLPAVCSPSSASCFESHSSPGCSDVSCCNSVCAVDSFCCSMLWDYICVMQTSDLCNPSFGGGEVRNPVNGHAYRRTSAHDFDATRVFAQSEGYHSADIANAKENEFIRNWLAQPSPFLLENPPRIGFNDRFLESSFVWTTAAPVTFVNWNPGQPGNETGDEDTVIMSPVDGRWFDADDSFNSGLIMERSFSTCGTAAGSCTSTHGPGCNDVSCCNEICFMDPFCCSTQWDSGCVSAAVTYCANAIVGAGVVNPATGSRYFLVSAGSWLQAEKRAAGMNGTLVSINSAAENEWVLQNFVKPAGLPDQIWIGLTDQSREGAFRWTNNAPLTYTNWGPGEPNQNGEEDFAMMTTTGKWNDTPNALSVGAVIEVPCLGDIDGDGTISGPDLGALLGQWDTSASTQGGSADFNADGIVNAADLAILLGAWGSCPTSNACTARITPGSDQPGCTICVCATDPFCCSSAWDGLCVALASNGCNAACQCGANP